MYRGNFITDGWIGNGFDDNLKSTVRLVGFWIGNQGTTFDNSFIISYNAYDSEGNKFSGTYTTTWVIGENNFSFNETETGELLPVSGTLWIPDTFTNDILDNLFTFLPSDISNKANFPYTLTGNSLPIPSNIDGTSINTVYLDVDVNGEGDYEINYIQRDPNGVDTPATNNPKIVGYRPHLFIYSVDGNYNMRDALPPVTKSSVTVEYVKGYNVLTNEDGTPYYDSNGELQLYGTGQVLSVSYPLVEGLNTIQIKNGENGADTTDDFGNDKDSDIKTISASIPDFTAWDDSDQFYGIVTNYPESNIWDDSGQFLGIIGDI